MLRTSRMSRAVAASVLRVLNRGKPEDNGVHDGHWNPSTQEPREPNLRGFSSHAL